MDFLELFRAFSQKRIRYLVVGGIAVNLHGVPRMTYDVDVILDEDEENIINYIRLLTGLGYRPKIPVNPYDFAKEDIRKKWIEEKNMKAFNLYAVDSPIHQIDVVINQSITYQDALKERVEIVLSDVRIPVVSIDHLILMKRDTGRKQDESDIESLVKIKRKINE